VNLGYPITRGGEVVGATFLALDLRALQEQLDALPLPPDALVTVVDRGGVVVARRPRGDSWVGIAPDLEIGRLATTGGAGTLQAPDLDGAERRFAYRAVHLPDAENALFVSAGVPTSRAAPWSLARSLTLYLVASVAALLATALVGELGVARPLGKVVAAARRLSAGDVEARTGLAGARGDLGELAAAFDDMAAKVAERRRLEEQLRQVHKMEAVGQLAGGIAHDFNNILTAILTFARFARDELPEGHPAREDILEILTAAERAASLTRELLAFSRRQASDPRPMVLADSVRAVEKMLRRLLGEHIEISVEANGSGAILADADQIAHVLLNLALNARDAMPGGGRLSVSVADVSGAPAGAGLPAGPLVVLEVADDGTGMDEATRARLFEPFFTTKPPGKGTGLGLASVYGIVTQAKGVIRVESAPGAGSRFTLCFPRHAAPPAVEEPAELPGGGRETVLVVEDDDAVRAVVRRTLARAGYSVVEASRPSEAEAAAARADLLLTDVLLPEESGAALARRLVASWPRLRVLFMSGYTGGHLAGEDLLATGAALLAKPFTSDALLAAVRAALDGRRGTRAA
jgi:signal transduction histidine kinase/ActR/RegA family two-component response regulator